MSAQFRRPSLLAGLLWIGLGALFLANNLGFGIDFWSLLGRYWPVLLILLGLGKLIDYYRKKETVFIGVGEVLGILLLLLIGTAITHLSEIHLGQVFRDLPIEIGGTSVRPGQWLGTSSSYETEETYPLGQASAIRIENSYGLVSVAPGSDGEIRVRFKKVVYENDEARAKQVADEIQLKGGPEPQTAGAGTVFVLKTNREDLNSKDYRFNTDLEIFIPRQSQLKVSSRFGEVRVSGIEGKLEVDTTHNPLQIQDCRGEFTVSNRYGETHLVNLSGNVKIEARGKVAIENIKGDVSVRNEYSPVEATDIDGVLMISNTEGDIQILRITQAAVIDARGCGIRAEGLKGSLKLTASHGEVQISDVAADVSIESSYGELVLKDIQGNVDIKSSSDSLSADGVRGHLKVQGTGSSIRGDRVEGPAEIQTTLKDVILNNFSGGCKVTNEHGDVSLSTNTLSKGEMTVRNRNGDVDLSLPPGASIQMEAEARNGEIQSEYVGLEPSGVRNGALKAKLGTGDTRIVVETDYGDIHLRPLSR
jgi:DUF4097 and DUF4098 domain-containing protein YvlB